MEATKWKVVSPKAYFWGKKIMKPGQIFTAAVDIIPPNLKKIIIPIDPVPVNPPVVLPEIVDQPQQEAVKEEVEEKVSYRMRTRRGTEFYDIFDSTGKRVNEHDLSQEDARKMVKLLRE